MLKTVRLELARSKDNPVGRADTGYEFKAPLDGDGHLDFTGWQQRKADCTVRHFEDGRDVESGRLVHRGAGWYFHYDGPAAEDDQPIFKFDKHRFVEGEYVSITEHDGVLRTFRVASVR
ncbi:MAG TPA: hypothetical protein VEY95_01795 [Azospirillaceae bacterium]|nr:hypothetical protein [Azospirillaceae bacterium]